MITLPRIIPPLGPRHLVAVAPLLALIAACTFDANGLGPAGGTTGAVDPSTTAPDLETTAITSSTAPTEPTTATGAETSMALTSTSTSTTSTTVPATTATTDTTGTTAMDTAGTDMSSTGPEAVCGNGVVEGDEACDDGNADNTDDCLDTCVPASCGDGFVQAGKEACDDGNNDEEDDCTNDCKFTGTFVFVTADVFTGNLGGLPGADKRCQDRADAAMLGGTWKAWLSTDSPDDGPAKRFVQSTRPYRLVTGVKIANNWADLIDGTLAIQIDRTETGGPGAMSQNVWTNTKTDGFYATNSDCSVWGTGNNGTYGNRTKSNSEWTNIGTTGCGAMHHLYCFQQ